MDPDPQWRGKGSSHSSHPTRHNLMSPQDHSETCSVSDTCSPGSAGCRLSFQQELQTGFLFSLPHSSFASQLLQTSCLLHFLKLALTAKNRIWSQRRTSPSFLSTLRLGNKSNYGVGYQHPQVQPNRGSHQREDIRRK